MQAAAYINENDVSLSKYLSLWDDTEENIIKFLSEDFEDERRYQDSKNLVARTWLISFEQIRLRDQLAADYLSFMSCLDPKRIPESLLEPGQSKKEAVDAIGTLTAYLFITRRDEDQSFDIHQLVHLATRNWLREQGSLVEWTRRALVRLADVFPDYDPRNRPLWRSYLPHTRHVLSSSLVVIDIEEELPLLHRLGRCLLSDGRYIEAEEQLTLVMKTSLRVLGREHPDTLTSMANLASTFWNQGRWKEAEELDVQVMETRKRLLGQEHPDTLTSMNNLSWTWKYQGRRDEAMKLMTECVQGLERKLSVDHPNTKAALSTLNRWHSETV